MKTNIERVKTNEEMLESLIERISRQLRRPMTEDERDDVIKRGYQALFAFTNNRETARAAIDSLDRAHTETSGTEIDI